MKPTAEFNAESDNAKSESSLYARMVSVTMAVVATATFVGDANAGEKKLRTQYSNQDTITRPLKGLPSGAWQPVDPKVKEQQIKDFLAARDEAEPEGAKCRPDFAAVEKGCPTEAQAKAAFTKLEDREDLFDEKWAGRTTMVAYSSLEKANQTGDNDVTPNIPEITGRPAYEEAMKKPNGPVRIVFYDEASEASKNIMGALRGLVKDGSIVPEEDGIYVFDLGLNGPEDLEWVLRSGLTGVVPGQINTIFKNIETSELLGVSENPEEFVLSVYNALTKKPEDKGGYPKNNNVVFYLHDYLFQGGNIDEALSAVSALIGDKNPVYSIYDTKTRGGEERKSLEILAFENEIMNFESVHSGEKHALVLVNQEFINDSRLDGYENKRAFTWYPGTGPEIKKVAGRQYRENGALQGFAPGWGDVMLTSR